MRFYVYRTGYNGANNSVRDGGPETVRVATVDADSGDEACVLAAKRVSVYNGQHLSAEDADKADLDDALDDSRVIVE